MQFINYNRHRLLFISPMHTSHSDTKNLAFAFLLVLFHSLVCVISPFFLSARLFKKASHTIQLNNNEHILCICLLCRKFLHTAYCSRTQKGAVSQTQHSSSCIALILFSLKLPRPVSSLSRAESFQSSLHRSSEDGAYVSYRR